MTNPNKQPVVVTVGVFDGVHAGHRELLSTCRQIADQEGATLVAATFDPSPKAFLYPATTPGLLTTPEHRTELLKMHGADEVKILHFDEQMSAMSPEAFVTDVLLEQLAADFVIVGRNFRFGHKAAGDVDALQKLSAELGFQVRIVDLAGDSQTWSSTRIRNSITSGDVALAREILGRPHRLSGEVVHGDHRGRELGFPTANLAVAGDLLVPADGVYAGILNWQGQAFPAAISVGTNPTFEGVLDRRVEAYVLDQTDLDLYGAQVDLDFLAHIRGMVAFSGIPELIAAMNLDVAQAREHISAFLESL